MTGRLSGKRILIVEDEYFIANDLKRALLNESAIVVGPVGDCAGGIAHAAEDSLDAAVLDINLGGSTSFALADRLEANSVPCMFVTGYDGWALPHAHRRRVRLGKPFRIEAVVDAVVDMVAGTPS